jgi:hypothetical protein
MAGLLGDVLPWAYSRGNALKRGVNGLLSDPLGSMEQTAGLLQDKHRENQQLNALAFADPSQPFKPTNQNALAALIDRTLNGPMGFAPVGMTRWSGTPLTAEEARALVAGKTEKVGGVDPQVWIDNTRRTMSLGRVPLSAVKANEEGLLYDGTVNARRAADYAQRPPDNVPPVLLVTGRRSGGFFNVLDGGHRVSAARMRGDQDIPAIVMELPER